MNVYNKKRDATGKVNIKPQLSSKTVKVIWRRKDVERIQTIFFKRQVARKEACYPGASPDESRVHISGYLSISFTPALIELSCFISYLLGVKDSSKQEPRSLESTFL